MENQPLFHGFLDESSTFWQPDRYFIVALVAVEDPRAVTWPRIIKRARERLGKKRHAFGELKFDKSDERTRWFVLTALAAQQNVEVAVTVVDKGGRRVPDTPEHYGLVVGQAAVDVLQRNPRLNLTVDKRYTAPKQETLFRRTVLRIALTGAHVAFGLTTLASEREPLLQLADFVAGAFYRKYNVGETRFADLFMRRRVNEKVYEWPALKDMWQEK